MKTYVVLVQDEVGPVESFHGQMQGRGIQELLGLMLPIRLGVIGTNETVLARLARVLALVPLVIIVQHMPAGFAQQGILKLTQALHDGGFKPQS